MRTGRHFSIGLPFSTQWNYRDILRHRATASSEDRGVTADPLTAAFARVPPTVGHPYIRGVHTRYVPQLLHLIGRKGAAWFAPWSRADRRSHPRLHFGFRSGCKHPLFLSAIRAADVGAAAASHSRESGGAGECHCVRIFTARNFACDLQAVTGRSLTTIPTLEASLDMPAGADLPLDTV